MGRKKSSYIACVTGQYGAERIIRATYALAQDADSPLYVLSVLPSSASVQSLEVMEYLNHCAKQVGAEMTVLYSDSPVHAAVEYIEYKRISCVVTGSPGDGSNGFISLISAVLPKVKLVVLPPEREEIKRLPSGIPQSAVCRA